MGIFSKARVEGGKGHIEKKNGTLHSIQFNSMNEKGWIEECRDGMKGHFMSFSSL